MRSTRRKLTIAKSVVALAGATMLLTASSCGGPPTAAEREADIKMGAYERLQRNQPAQEMQYSPTRDTINKWVEQWGRPGTLSYVYILQTGNPTPLGYYILEGLPVSYCTSQTPPYNLIDRADTDFLAPAPGVDGTYYSGQGCDQYFGIEAGTGTVVEFGGGNVGYLLSERPLRVDAPPLATATVEDNPPPAN